MLMNYDFIAIVELRDETVLMRTEAYWQAWEGITTIVPGHGRAKVIADREDVEAPYDTVRRWCRDWRQK